MATIKRWALGKLGEGPIELKGVQYTQGLDDEEQPGIQGMVPTDYVDWEITNRPLIDLTDNDEKLNTHIEINARQIGNGIFEELGDKFLVSIINNKLTRAEIYKIIKFKEERYKVINMRIPDGYRYQWTEIADDLTEDYNTVIGTESTTDSARWYWKQWVDGVIVEDEFTEVDTSTVITDANDRQLVKEVLNNRAQLLDLTPLHVDSGVAFINGNYSTITESKSVYDESSFHMVGPVKHYDTSSGSDTLLKDIEDEVKRQYSSVTPETWEITLVITEVDVTGTDPHDEYDLYVTIGSNNYQYHGQFIPLIVADFIWAHSDALDLLYDKLFGIGEILIPNPAQRYDVSNENTPFREYDPRYKTKTSGHGYPQSDDPNVLIRQSGRNFVCDNKGILPVNNAQLFREFEAKETTIDTSGAVNDTVNIDIPIKDQATQVELRYEFTDHIKDGEGRWDDYYATWIAGYEPGPTAVKNINAIAEFDSAIYFAYHHKLYRLVQNTSEISGDSLDTITTSIDEGEFTFGLAASAPDNTVVGNDSDDFEAGETITALATYDGWLYIGTSNGYLFRFQQGGTGANNTIEQVTAAGNPVDFGRINSLYVWSATDQLAVGANYGFRLIEHQEGNPTNVTIEDLGTETPLIAAGAVTAFTETSKYGSGYVQVLLVGTVNQGIYYYGDRDFNSGRRLHHDDNYPNFVIAGSGDIHFDDDYASNYCTIKKFIKHKSEQDADMYMLVGIGESDDGCMAWDDGFGHHEPGDDELWKIIDGNNEGDHEHFNFQKEYIYESHIWAIDNLLTNADFEEGTTAPDNWTATGATGGATFTKTEDGRFNIYSGLMHNIASNNLQTNQTYAPSGGLGIIDAKTFTFSIYLKNNNAAPITVEIGIKGLNNVGTELESGSTNVNLTSQNVWGRYTITKTFSNVIYQLRPYIKITTAGDITIDAAKLEEAASATAFNAGGVTTTDFTNSNHACYINDMASFNDHIIVGGLRDVRGEDGDHFNSPGYSYPAGAPADEEYPCRPDGGINSGIDTIDGSATNTIDNVIVDYLASDEGFYYIDQLILYNTAYGLDFFTFFTDATGSVWSGSKGRIFKIHSEKEESTSDYVAICADENAPTTFRAIIRVPAGDNEIDLIDAETPSWHTFVESKLLLDANKERMKLIKGSVKVKNNSTGRVTYIEGRDYEIEYDPTNSNYGKIKRKPNPLFEGDGYGRIEPDQTVWIEYKYFHILEEIIGSAEGYKNLDIEARTATINLPSDVLSADYELFCDFVYTKEFRGVNNTEPTFETPSTGIKENLKPYDFVVNPPSAHIWSEKFHLIVYSRNQRNHSIYADYQFSIPRIDIVQLNYALDEDGFITSIAAGIPHESAPQEPNPLRFDETTMDAAVAGGGGLITRQHIWYGFMPTSDAIKMYTMNVTQQNYFLNDIYDKRYYITKLQLWDYFIGIKSDTAAYFPFSRSFVSSNGNFRPEPKVAGDPTTAVQNSTIESISADNVCQYNDFAGEFDEQGVYDNEAEFKVYWEYTPDYFGLATIDEYGVGQWKATGDPPYDPGVKRGIYVVSAQSSGIGADNSNSLQINRNLTISQSFLDAAGDVALEKDIYQFDLHYYLENAYGAVASSELEVRIYYDDPNATGELYYSTSLPYTGGADNLTEDKLDIISVRTEAAIIPKRIEIVTSGWDESDEFRPGDPEHEDYDKYVGATHYADGVYRPKLNLYLSIPRLYRTGIDNTKFYQSAARFGERIQYPVKLNGLAGSLYFKFKPLFRYNFNENDNSSVVLFDSRASANQENYFQIIYDAKNYNTIEPLDKANFSNLGTNANPYPRWPAEGGSHYNSFKIVFYARELNMRPNEIVYKYKSYALDINDTTNKARLKYENNIDFQVFHTFLMTWERIEEMYPDPLIFSDGYNNWQFMMTFYFDDMDPISKLVIIDPNILENFSTKFQLGGGWLKTSYNPTTQTITWFESTSEGFISELRLEDVTIDYDKAQLWINKKLPFLDANNIPVMEDILTLTNEVQIVSGTTGDYANMRLNDMFVEGDLYVMGTEVISNISKMIIEDNIIEVNRIQEFDEDGNWVGVPQIASPTRSGLKSYRHPDQETYDSSIIWNEDDDEWQLIELSKFSIVYDDNVLLGATWETLIGTAGTGATGTTGTDNVLYTSVTKSDNEPTALYRHSKGTWTFKIQLKSNDGSAFDVRIRLVAQLHDLTEEEHYSNDFEITTSYQERIFRVIYDTDEIEQITIYIEVAEPGHAASDIGYQNEFLAKTTINTTDYETPHETQDLRLRKLIVGVPIANPGEEAYITFESNKSAIKVMAEDGLYINNDTLVDSMVLKAENDIDTNVELQLYNSGASISNLRLNAIRPNYIENITDNSILTVFSGKVGGVQKYNLQISKSGHIEPGADATDIYFSTTNDSLQIMHIDSDANIYFRQAHLTNRDEANSSDPLVGNVVESVKLNLNDDLGTQDCIRITKDQSGTGAIELAPIVASEIALHNANDSSGIKYEQAYKITFSGRVAGQSGHTQATILHNLNISLDKTVVTLGVSSPLRHVYWDPVDSNVNTLVVKLDDENTMTTTNDPDPNNWVDPNDGKIIVYCIIREQIPVTAGITMS